MLPALLVASLYGLLVQVVIIVCCTVAASCRPGELTYVQREGSERAAAYVRHRNRRGRIFLTWTDGQDGNASFPVTAVRDSEGKPCARAALCLFGRIGNAKGRYAEHGSSAETLKIAAPTIWAHVIEANSDYTFDIVAHTWDVALAGEIQRAFAPIEFEAAEQPQHLDSVGSFGETVSRTTSLKRRAETRFGQLYDLVVLMRYDMFFRRPLLLNGLDLHRSLWTGYWCSVNALDLSAREIRLIGNDEDLISPEIRAQNPSKEWQDMAEKYLKLYSFSQGVFAPSQFINIGLHDYWFAASSTNIDRFGTWGSAVETFRNETGLGTSELPLHSGHFYTFLHARTLGLVSRFVGFPYVDYTLVRWRECEIVPADQVHPENIFCGDANPVSFQRACWQWLYSHPGWGSALCPLAGRRAVLVPGSRDCWRF